MPDPALNNLSINERLNVLRQIRIRLSHICVQSLAALRRELNCSQSAVR